LSCFLNIVLTRHRTLRHLVVLMTRDFWIYDAYKQRGRLQLPTEGLGIIICAVSFIIAQGKSVRNTAWYTYVNEIFIP
jgi:hypothetical protein